MKTELNFEQSMKRLEEIVAKLERGDAPLEDSLAMFEEGTALITRCNRLLDKAEQRVVMLTRGADGAPEEREFDEKAVSEQ